MFFHVMGSVTHQMGSVMYDTSEGLLGDSGRALRGTFKPLGQIALNFVYRGFQECSFT